GLGISCALFWLTREEGVWLVPTVALALGYTALRASRDKTATHRFFRASTMLLVPAVVVCTAIAFIAACNYRYYGVACMNELKSPFFTKAYGALTRVEAPYRAITPVTAAAREKIYAVSPALAELKGWLDPEDTGADPREYFGGAFIWRFRESVSASGH